MASSARFAAFPGSGAHSSALLSRSFSVVALPSSGLRRLFRAGRCFGGIMSGKAVEDFELGFPGLRLEESGEEIWTVGLGAIGHAELRTAISGWASAAEARGVLFRVAAYVVGADARLQPGDVLRYEAGALTLRSADGFLEVVSRPATST